METKIWIQRDGRQQGPFSLAELAGAGIEPRTPVWYQGLSDWTAACEAPLTAGLFYSTPVQAPPCPPTYIAWAVVVTICCCLIGGIVAIIYSSQVTSRYAAHDYEGAVRASSRAELWIILSIVFGLVGTPFAYLLGVGGLIF